MKRFSILPALLLAAATAPAATPAAAQVAFGPQVSWADDADFGIGARVTFPLTQLMTADADSPAQKMMLIGSFDWFFPDDGDVPDLDVRYYEINANVAYTPEVEGLDPYFGGGLNIANAGISGGGESVSDTEVGLNILGGLNFLLGTFNTFAEGRLELSGGEQFVLTFGALFGSP